MKDYMYKGRFSRSPYKPLLISLVISGFIIFVAREIYFDFAEWEQTDEIRYEDIITVFLYKIGGKSAVAGAMALFGSVIGIMGALTTLSYLNIKRKSASRNT